MFLELTDMKTKDKSITVHHKKNYPENYAN